MRPCFHLVAIAAAATADEAAWKRIDADLKRAWDASDWTAFDDACRRAFARLAGD